MPATQSITGARAGVSYPLTNLAQAFEQPDFVMRLLFPLAEVGTYGGTIVSFDDSLYEDVQDDRADDASYPEITSGYTGSTYKLDTKGLRYRVPDKRRKEMENMRINWGQIAADALMKRAALRHEIEAAMLATNASNYASTNRLTLTTGSQLNDDGVDPDPLIRAGSDTIAEQIGARPNVMVLGLRVFSALAANYARNFTSVATAPGLRPQLTKQVLADIFGFQRVEICNAIYKVNGARTQVFGKHIVMAYTNPAAVNGNSIPYRPTGAIDAMTSGYGYTYVMQGNPLMYNPWVDQDRKATVFDLDFDRKVVAAGVNSSGAFTHGYLISNAVA
jgi:hypothetical protein